MSDPSFPTLYLLPLPQVHSLAHGVFRIQNALENLKMLIEKHSAHTTLVFNLEEQLKGSHKVRRRGV